MSVLGWNELVVMPNTRSRTSLRGRRQSGAGTCDDSIAKVPVGSKRQSIVSSIDSEQPPVKVPGTSDSKDEPMTISALQKARIENNRLKALQLRKTKNEAEEQKKAMAKKVRQAVAVDVDTGAGFFVPDDDNRNMPEDEDVDYADLLDSEPFVIAGDGSAVECDECSRPFSLSFLKTKFSCNICDGCHDRDVHKLITRTTAKSKYLLKDADLDRREPPLQFITKKNPKYSHWGEMKLYLESQCYDRAMEIWKSMDAIEEEETRRKIMNAKSKAKKYDKKMNDLKKEVRSSLYKVKLSGHTHEWGAENYNEENDEYTKQCSTCGHTLTYEKM